MSDRQILVVLASLKAEGTQRLTLDLCSAWKEIGIAASVVSLSGDNREMAGAFEGQDIPLDVFNIPTISRRDYPAIFKAVRKTVRNTGCRGVISMPSGVHAIIHAAAKSAGAKRTVVHLGTYPWHWHGAPFRKYRLLFKIGAPFTDAVACVSQHVLDGAQKHLRVPRSALHLIYNGVDVAGIAAADPIDDLVGSGTIPAASMCGRLDSTKDYETLIAAAALLQERGEAVRFFFIGDGAGRGELERLVHDRKLADHIHFLGVRDDVPRIMKTADVFAFSVKPEEGQGIALVEAMAAGVPVVASDVGACREVLDGGRCGLLVKAGDAQAMADGIRTLIADEERATALANAARLRVRDLFDIRRTAEGYARLLGLGDVPAA